MNWLRGAAIVILSEAKNLSSAVSRGHCEPGVVGALLAAPVRRSPLTFLRPQGALECGGLPPLCPGPWPALVAEFAPPQAAAAVILRAVSWPEESLFGLSAAE